MAYYEVFGDMSQIYQIAVRVTLSQRRIVQDGRKKDWKSLDRLDRIWDTPCDREFLTRRDDNKPASDTGHTAKAGLTAEAQRTLEWF